MTIENLIWKVKMLIGVIGSIPSIVAGVILIWGTLLKRGLFGEMRKITNCKIDGQKIKLIPFMRALNIIGRPFVIDSDEGKIIVCHGQPNGRFALDPKDIFGNNNATYRQLIEALNLEPGEYKILSCFNGKRKDYNKDGYTIRRVQGTLTPYPTVASMVGGTLRISADRWFFECFIRLMTPIFQWGHVDNIIKDVENTPAAAEEEQSGIFGGIRRQIFDPEEIERIKGMIRNANK